MSSEFDSVAFLKTMTHQPGVYRMYNSADEVIYVGKAKHLKNRLSSYFRTQVSSEKTRALVRHIDHIDVTITHTETEALILEHNYIKQYLPKYNVLLRDDKSYPYILLSAHLYPRLSLSRGAKKQKGNYFGPYPNSGAVKETLHVLQKIFPIRQCEDSVYANRSRPCLMYQIGRCLGPCVSGLVTDHDYAEQVNLVRLFLQGKDQQVIALLIDQMTAASTRLDFELAAKVRDQIQALQRIQAQQFVSSERYDDLDVIALIQEGQTICFHALFIRNGNLLGSRSYFPKVPKDSELTEVVVSFLSQFYLNQTEGRTIPNKIIINEIGNSDIAELSTAFSHVSGHKVAILASPKGDLERYLQLAVTNAKSALKRECHRQLTTQQRMSSLLSVLGLTSIQRMECFDISHTQGEKTVASCIVFNDDGPLKSAYRRFNISGITGGDDYAAMAQALTLRYQDMMEMSTIPDVIFIDGGKGQLSRASDILNPIMALWPRRSLLVGIAKGTSRKPGLETLLLESGVRFSLPSDSAALHVIQYIRDESHRFAITGHRARRDKARKRSTLEDIEGIGPKRRQALLLYMGGLQALKRANRDDIAKVPGISRSLADKIFNALQHS